MPLKIISIDAVKKYLFLITVGSFLIPLKHVNFEKHNDNVKKADASRNTEFVIMDITILMSDQNKLSENEIQVLIRVFVSTLNLR